MKKPLIYLAVTAGFLCCVASPLFAQDSRNNSDVQSLPIVPISVEFRHVSQYFRQDLGQDSRYSSITALINNATNPPWYEIILRERASSTQVYYSNSMETVAALLNQGDEAYDADISIQGSGGSGDSRSETAFQIQFKDNSGGPIRWDFKVGVPSISYNTTGTQADFLDRPDDHGLVLLHVTRLHKAAPGTVATVGDSSYPAHDDALFSENVLLAWIEPTTDNWSITGSPSRWNAGSQWSLRDSSGVERTIKIERVSGDQISLRVQDANNSNAAPMLLDVQRSGGELGLLSLTALDRMNTLKISFQPALPLPATAPPDKKQVNFTIDENIGDDQHHGVASGQATATRGLGDEHLTWHFNSPDWARAVTFDTGANILAGSQGMKARGTL